MENTKEIVKQVKKNLDKLLKQNDQILSNLPDEHKAKVLPIQLDIQAVMRAAKSGDMNKIIEISKRYADTNNI
jgi:hypothetical protein